MIRWAARRRRGSGFTICTEILGIKSCTKLCILASRSHLRSLGVTNLATVVLAKGVVDGEGMQKYVGACLGVRDVRVRLVDDVMDRGGVPQQGVGGDVVGGLKVVQGLHRDGTCNIQNPVCTLKIRVLWVPKREVTLTSMFNFFTVVTVL